jgi:DNA-binding GntR family transcriptional regulator
MESLQAISPPKSLTQIAYGSLRKSILNGEMRAGELYNEMAIAKQLGISRTPIREALLELSNKGMVTFLPRRGVIVRSLSKEDVTELFELRQVLETHFITKIAATPSAYDFSVLEQNIKEQKTAALKKNIPDYLRYNAAFHNTMAEMCNNQRMLEIYGAIVDLIRLLALQSLQHPMRMQAHLIPQHKAILDSIKGGETKQATKLLTTHLKESKQAALEGIQSLQTNKQL